MSRALREALEGYCTPDMGATIVQTALARVGLVAPPETPTELSDFVTGALSPEVERRLGDDAATDLEQRMAVMIHVLSRASRPVAPEPALVLDDDFGPEPVSETRPLPIEVVPPRAAPPGPAPPTKPPLGRAMQEFADRAASASSDRPTSPPEPTDDDPILELSTAAPSDRPTKPPEPADDDPVLELSTAAPSDRPTQPPESLALDLSFEPPTSPRAHLPSAPASDRPTVPPAGAVTASSDSVRNIAVGVVSPDSKLAGRVRAALGDGGHAFGYRTLPDLARAEPGSLDAVLIDRRGSAPSSTLVLPEAVRGAQVVLWPAKPEAAVALGKTATHAASVTSFGADVAVEDLVVIVRLAAARR